MESTSLAKQLPLEYLDLQTVRDWILRATAPNTFYPILQWFEDHSPLAHATLEQGLFGLMPPCLLPPTTWKRLVKTMPIARRFLPALLDNGFMPADRELLQRRLRANIFQNRLTHYGNYSLLDTDYGVMIVDQRGRLGRFWPGRLRNAGIDLAMIDRYGETDDRYYQQPQLIFAVGAERGQRFYLGKEQGHDAPVEVHASTKTELENIIARLRANLPGTNYELWFRGQPREYTLQDLTEAAYAGICPWRSVRDFSLVPSLYRSINDKLQDLRAYSEDLLELQAYTLFMDSVTKTFRGEDRPVSAPSTNPLPKGWHEYRFTMSMIPSDGGEDRIASDSTNGFAGLQRSFFLQHYGLPSPILDITNDPEVALFFAQHRVTRQNRFERISQPANPVILCLILDKQRDRFLPSEALMMGNRLLRPLNQRCGLLCGASLVTRNYYSRFIAVRIILDGPLECAHKQEALFPGPEEDDFLARLIAFAEEEQLALRPFVLGRP
jgi:FRG domain